MKMESGSIRFFGVCNNYLDSFFNKRYDNYRFYVINKYM